MRTTEVSLDDERDRLALRFLYIGHLLMGGGRDSSGKDSISSRQYEQLTNEAEAIARRIRVIDRQDAVIHDQSAVGGEYTLVRSNGLRSD